MANLPARIKCDQCGTVIDRNDARDWLNIRSRKDLVSFYVADKGVDLCSASCLLDYATAQRTEAAARELLRMACFPS